MTGRLFRIELEMWQCSVCSFEWNALGEIPCPLCHVEDLARQVRNLKDELKQERMDREVAELEAKHAAWERSEWD